MTCAKGNIPINWNWYFHLCRKVLTKPVLERLFPGELFLVGANLDSYSLNECAKEIV